MTEEEPFLQLVNGDISDEEYSRRLRRENPELARLRPLKGRTFLIRFYAVVLGGVAYNGLLGLAISPLWQARYWAAVMEVVGVMVNIGVGFLVGWWGRRLVLGRR
jgi:hypothetical protein